MEKYGRVGTPKIRVRPVSIGAPNPTKIPTSSAKSKVREYIAEKKHSDQLNSNRTKEGRIGVSLEDLYQVTQECDLPSQVETAQTELRKTLRLVKEKDLIILKLRETCHELTIKYADAENAIDQLRFGRGGMSSRGPLMRKSISAFNIDAKSEDSENKKTTTMKDQSTETRVDILEESCSNWMEKVQNWKTESGLNASAADADSGFLGSEFESSGRKKSSVVGGSLLPKYPSRFLVQNSTESTSSSKKNSQCQTIGTNTEPGDVDPEPEPRLIRPDHSQSFNDLTSFTASHKSEPRGNSQIRIDHFKTLDPLIDEATAIARRVQRKSRRLAKLIQGVDKIV